MEDILQNKHNLISFLKSNGYDEERKYNDDTFKNTQFVKIGARKLLAVCEADDERQIKEIKNHFLLDKGLSHVAIFYDGKVLFYRNYGERRYFVYSKRTESNISKIHKLKQINKDFDEIFRAKDISGSFYENFKTKRNFIVRRISDNIEPENKFLLVQKIFDRIFFIYFLCHKGIVRFQSSEEISGENFFNMLIEEGDFQRNLYDVFDAFNSQEKNVISLGSFKIIIPYLNGGLFRIDPLEFEIKIKLTKKEWKEIFGFLNSYHWIIEDEVEDVEGIETKEERILTPEILGHVYERSVVEWELKGFHKQVEEAIKRTSERKEKGVYYTREEITDYICKNTLYNFLLDKLNNNYTDIEEFFEKASKKELVTALHILNHLKVIDPACGSGAFLIKAGELLFKLQAKILTLLGEKFRYFDIKNSIIVDNIFGVDILQGAIEIAKLRLWLWLISSYTEQKEVKALPNIEYNLVVGNSLIGWTDERLDISLSTPLTDEIRAIFKGLISSSSRLEREAFSKAQSLFETFDLSNYIHGYAILHGIYKNSHGARAVYLKEILETIRNSVYGSINHSFLNFINSRVKRNYNKKKPPINKTSFEQLLPLHWKVDFGSLMENGGFDIIIENPPYGNRLKDIEKKCMRNYATLNANEIAANFIERSTYTTKKDGYLGVVVANSIAINNSTSSARDLIRKYMSNSKMALFGTRPAKLFDDAEIRVLIFWGKKDIPDKEGTIFTSDAIKFTQDQRDFIFNHISFENTSGLTLGKYKIGDNIEDSSLPKVGNATIRNILLKLKEKSTSVIGNRINKAGFKARLEFRKTGGYWLNALEKIPYTSTKIEKVKFENELERDFCILIINSSLFYLYWSTYGNLRDLPLSLIEKFPFPPISELTSYQKRIQELKQELSECLLNSFLAERGRVGEFRTGFCKNVIDSVDDLLGDIYGLNDKEIEYVKNYDSHIRRPMEV